MSTPGDRDRVETVRRLAWILDSLFRVPGTRLRFGIEPLIGLVPGLGDAVNAVLSGLVLWHAFRLRVPWVVQLRMAVNILLYAGIGTIPVVGDAWDFFFKANRRNLALLERAIGPGQRTRPSDWVVVLGALAALLLAILVPLMLIGALIAALASTRPLV